MNNLPPLLLSETPAYKLKQLLTPASVLSLLLIERYENHLVKEDQKRLDEKIRTNISIAQDNQRSINELYPEIEPELVHYISDVNEFIDGIKDFNIDPDGDFIYLANKLEEVKPKISLLLKWMIKAQSYDCSMPKNLKIPS